MDTPEVDATTPEADAAEQRVPASPDRETVGGDVVLEHADASEADLLEQQLVVEEDQTIDEPERRDDASDADLLEQAVGVPVDDERR